MGSTTMPGTIEAVNADGSFAVSARGGTDYWDPVQSADKNTYQEGDTVNLLFLEGNTNIVYIYGAGAYRA